MNTPSLQDLGKQPIPGPLVAGSELREEPEFEALESEIAKLSSPVHSSTLDWGKVNQIALELLATKGKDMLVASYLTGGLLETRGLPGLADGLKVLADLLETYWDNLFPTLKRMRGRRNAIQWLIDRIQQRAIESDWAALAPQPEELLLALTTHLQAIDRVLLDKDTDAPSVRSVLTLIKAIPAIDARPVAAEPSALKSAGAAPPVHQATELVLDSSEQCERALDKALEQIKSISEWFLSHDAGNPLAYRLSRAAAWLPIDTLPPADAGSTKIPPPLLQVVDVLQRLKANQADMDLVQFAETQLSTFPFWLDLNCVCAQALGRLGSDFSAAQAEVCGHTVRLIERLPGLAELTFDGGMPFADAETQNWLATLAVDASGQAGAKSNSASRDSDSVMRAISTARGLAAGDDLLGAADCLQQQLATKPPARDQLVIRIRLCELLLAHRPRAALHGFAESILATIDHHALATWDPDLAIDGMKVAYGVWSRDDDDKDLAASVLAKIALLDATAAVKLLT